jgi:hypothetical protein
VIEFGLILTSAIWLVVATLNVAANFETPLALFIITVVVTTITIFSALNRRFPGTMTVVATVAGGAALTSALRRRSER